MKGCCKLVYLQLQRRASWQMVELLSNQECWYHSTRARALRYNINSFKGLACDFIDMVFSLILLLYPKQYDLFNTFPPNDAAFSILIWVTEGYKLKTLCWEKLQILK